jgi:hypothetical protein
MWTNELSDLTVLIFAAIVPAVALSVAFVRYRSAWSRRRAVLLAALPVPVIVWAFCLILFVKSAIAPAEQCGVDACGMAMAASFFVSIYALVACGAGLATAWLVRRIALS